MWSLRRVALCVFVSLLGAASAGAEAEPGSADEVLECMRHTRPLTNTVRKIALVRRDRAGTETTLRARIYGGVARDGYRTLLLQVSEPEDLRDLTLLITEAQGANHLFVSPSGLPDVKQIKRAPGQGRMFGTDFSYEDFQRLYGLSKPGGSRTLRSDTIGDRPTWVLETLPAEEELSAYERIVSHVDRETCVLLRAEMFEPGDALRKVLEATPERIAREGKIWVAHEVVLRDLREQTSTRLVVDEIEMDIAPAGIPFTPDELREYKRKRLESEAATPTN